MRLTKSFEEASPSTQAWWSCSGLVYFLGVGRPTIAVKIGMLAISKGNSLQTALARRLSSIQSSNHELVYVLGLVHFTEGKHPTKDAEDLERSLHLEFAHLARFEVNTRGAEWFNADSELLAKVQEQSRPHTEFGVPHTIGTLARVHTREA